MFGLDLGNLGIGRAGQSFLVRYADDAVLVFERKDDAERVMEVIGRRFAKYGLELHPDKTRLVEFIAPGASRRRRGGDEDGPGSFDLLGFTHVWGKSRKGNWVVQRKTAKGRLARALQHMTSWCRRNQHRAVKEQHKVLCWKLRGYQDNRQREGVGAILGRGHADMA